jgi:regulation of enolase protein 1 (concanavalin A-like superfamily)
MQWLNEPGSWKDENGMLTVRTAPRSDFWRKTHYGFIRDNGHFYGQTVSGDFVAEVMVSGNYHDLYDHAGLMVRLDEATWIKCGIEFFEGSQHVSAVVTRDYSDWSVIPAPHNPASLWLRVTRHGEAVEIKYSFDGQSYMLLRQAHLTDAVTLTVGPMCASPEGNGFDAMFEGFSVKQP